MADDIVRVARTGFARAMSDERAVCAHLGAAEEALQEAGLGETYRGQPWTDRCRNWVYFDRIVPVAELLERGLYDPTVVTVHSNLDRRSGTEMGLYCTLHHDGLMGPLPPAADRT